MGGVAGKRGQGVRRFGIALGGLALAVLWAKPAVAQQSAAPLVPIITPLRGDDLFASRGGPRLTELFSPLQLSLTGGLFPVGSVLPGCDSRQDASGNSVSGFALQHYSFLRITTALTLHGYSMGGCFVDAGLGGGFTYHLPLGKSVWLVPSAGFYALPTSGGSTTPLLTASARVDLVKQLAWGRTLSLGLGVRQRGSIVQTNAVSFGGSF